MTAPHRRVIVLGKSADKLVIATAVLESHGFTATGVLSEQGAHQAIAQPDELFAVVLGDRLDGPAKNRLRAAASAKGAVLISAHTGHDDPQFYFTRRILPKLIATWDRALAPNTVED
jgi:hypothetical protein